MTDVPPVVVVDEPPAECVQLDLAFAVDAVADDETALAHEEAEEALEALFAILRRLARLSSSPEAMEPAVSDVPSEVAQ